MPSWDELTTRHGQLQEMAATLSRAKSEVESVMIEYPEEVTGSAWLEQAIGLIGRSETEIDARADEMVGAA